MSDLKQLEVRREAWHSQLIRAIRVFWGLSAYPQTRCGRWWALLLIPLTVFAMTIVFLAKSVWFLGKAMVRFVVWTQLPRVFWKLFGGLLVLIWRPLRLVLKPIWRRISKWSIWNRLTNWADNLEFSESSLAKFQLLYLVLFPLVFLLIEEPYITLAVYGIYVAVVLLFLIGLGAKSAREYIMEEREDVVEAVESMGHTVKPVVNLITLPPRGAGKFFGFIHHRTCRRIIYTS